MSTTEWCCVLGLVFAMGCDDSGGGEASGGGLSLANRATTQQEQAACDAVEACGESRDDCDQLFGISVLSGACAVEIETASCEDHEGAAAPDYADVCLPPCASESRTCTSDGMAVTLCTDEVDGTFRRLLITCEDVCADNERSWTGECGTEYMGQPSSTGEDTCWCDVAGTG